MYFVRIRCYYMKNDNKVEFISEIAKLYYQYNYTQSEIAKRYGISRVKVSRILTDAKESGIVKIFIDDLVNTPSNLEDQLMARFNLKGIKVISVPIDDMSLIFQMTTNSAAEYFASLFKSGDHIGVSWGYTIYTMAKYFPDLLLNDVYLMQITGNIDLASVHSNAGEIIGIMGSKFHSEKSFTLPCPVILDNKIILDMLLHDKNIRNRFNMACECNKVIVNLTVADENNYLYEAGYITDNDLKRLRERNVAGSICCRFIDNKGQICDQELDERTFGIGIEDLKNKEYVMACVANSRKVPALLASLRSRLINVLVIDSISAKLLLNLANAKTEKTE